MPKTIKEVLESLDKGEYLGKGGVDTALAEIRQLLKECEPGVVPDMDRLEENPKEMAEWGGYVEAVNQYTANIEKRLG